MPYAFVQDVPASWEQYRHIAGAVNPDEAAGLILHLAGPTDEGVRIIEVWESEAAWRRFESQALSPARAALSGPPQPASTTRELRALHLVLGRPGRTKKEET
jgi:hypothetical protein